MGPNTYSQGIWKTRVGSGWLAVEGKFPGKHLEPKEQKRLRYHKEDRQQQQQLQQQQQEDQQLLLLSCFSFAQNP